MTKVKSNKTLTNGDEQRWVVKQFLKKRLEMINLIDEEIEETRERLEQLREELAMIECEESFSRTQTKKCEIAVQVNEREEQPTSVRPNSRSSQIQTPVSQLCRNCTGAFCSSNCLKELSQFLQQLAINNQPSGSSSVVEATCDNHVQHTTNPPMDVHEMPLEPKSSDPIPHESPEKLIPQNNPQLDMNSFAHKITAEIAGINSRLDSINKNLFAPSGKPSGNTSPSIPPQHEEESPLSSLSTDNHIEYRDEAVETSFMNSITNNVPSQQVVVEEGPKRDTFSKHEDVLLQLEQMLLSDHTEYLDLPQKRPRRRPNQTSNLPFAEPQSEQFKRDVSLKMFRNKPANDLLFGAPNHNTMLNSSPQNNPSNISTPVSNQDDLDREQFWNDLLQNKHNSFGELTFS